MVRLRNGERIDGWRFEVREERVGYWHEFWYHGDQLVYQESYNDFTGHEAIDYRTNTVWIQDDNVEDWFDRQVRQFYANMTIYYVVGNVYAVNHP